MFEIAYIFFLLLNPIVTALQQQCGSTVDKLEILTGIMKMPTSTNQQISTFIMFYFMVAEVSGSHKLHTVGFYIFLALTLLCVGVCFFSSSG